MKRLAIFDLDGTLLNTIADLAGATNYALKECGYPTHSTDEYRFFVGNGINNYSKEHCPKLKEAKRTSLKSVLYSYPTTMSIMPTRAVLTMA